MSKVHVLPVNDVREHQEEAWCLCGPKIEEDGQLIVHNSFDGREHFEKNHIKEDCEFCLTEPVE